MAQLKATTYDELNAVISRSQGYRVNSQEALIGNNTRARRNASDGVITVSLHYNDIVAMYPDGKILFTFAGWPTMTTCDRINQFLPFVSENSDGIYHSCGVRVNYKGECKSRPNAEAWISVHAHVSDDNYLIPQNRIRLYDSETTQVDPHEWFHADPLMSQAKTLLIGLQSRALATMVAA